MSDEPDKPVDLYVYQESDLISRAIDAMGREYYRKLDEQQARLGDGGTVFVDDEGNEVGYLIPVADPEESDE